MMSSDLSKFDILADRIRLHRQVDARPIIITEGVADQRFLQRVLPVGFATVFLAQTRDVALEATGQLARSRISRFACVVDRDFDDQVQEWESKALPIVAYDNADLEAMLWRSRALDDLLVEVGSSTKLATFGGIDRVRQTVEQALLPLQRLRRASAVGGLGLPFDALRLQARVSRQTLSIGIASICSALWTPECSLGVQELRDIAQSGSDPMCPVSGESLYRGKDCLAVLGVALRHLVGNLPHIAAKSERLEEAIRLAASAEIAASMSWYRRLTDQLGV